MNTKSFENLKPSVNFSWEFSSKSKNKRLYQLSISIHSKSKRASSILIFLAPSSKILQSLIKKLFQDNLAKNQEPLQALVIKNKFRAWHNVQLKKLMLQFKLKKRQKHGRNLTKKPSNQFQWLRRRFQSKEEKGDWRSQREQLKRSKR